MSTADLIAVINPPRELAGVFAAAAADADSRLVEITHFEQAGVGVEQVQRAFDAERLAKATGGIDREQRVNQAISERAKAEGDAATLRRLRKELAALQEYFPELFPERRAPGGAKIEAKPLSSGGSLPALTQSACNQAGLKPYEMSWRDYNPPPRKDEAPRRTRRRFKFEQTAEIEAEAAESNLRFEAEGVVTLAATAGEDKLPTFSMVAYSGGEMRPRGFSLPVVADLSTTKILANPRPMLLNHDQTKIVGHGDVKLERGQIIVTNGVISGAGEAAEEVRASAKKQFPWKASIGANPGRLETIEAGKSVTVNGRTFRGPLIVARDVTVHEVSFVALPGDDATSTSIAANRGNGVGLQSPSGQLTAAEQAELQQLRAQRQSAPIITAIQSAGDTNQTVLSHLRRVALAAGLNPISPMEIIQAATSGLHGFDEFSRLVRAPIIAGFQAGEDSTLGWTRRVSLDDYREFEVGTIDQAVRLSQVGRGQTAAHISYKMTSPAGSKLARFGVQFQIDAQDLIDGLRMGPLQISLEEIGKAFARLIPDLVWSYVLSNPTLEDGTVLFHSSRANISTGGGSVLGSTSLATAAAGIGNQVLPVERGGYAHMNLQPRFLMVPPDLNYGARVLARNLDRGDGKDIEVRAESRMGTAGVIDPLADDILAGTATNWLLAAPAEQAPSIFVGTLGGATLPTIRSGELKGHGAWGMWFDLQFSASVIATDGRGLHWATGA